MTHLAILNLLRARWYISEITLHEIKTESVSISFLLNLIPRLLILTSKQIFGPS